MDYIVSARKYRPATFESVVGQKALTDTLRNAIRQNKLAHAYLFCGPRGVGKTTCARIFAKTINCLTPTAEHDACNTCESCRAFNEQRSFNIHELDAASNNSVEDIRTLIQEVRIPPQIGRYSVYIIDEVHMLSQGAFNALLKTLEEPPSYAVFILATTEKHKVLPTILSRCQVYDFQRITVMDIVQHLQYVAAQEGVTAEEQALNVVAKKADGGMRDALSIFDQLVAFCGNNITYRQTIEVLNVLDTEYYFRLMRHALKGEAGEALLLFNEVLQKGFDAAFFVTGFAEHLRDILVAKDAQTVALLETSDAVRRQYAEAAAACPVKWLFRALDVLNTCDINYRTARNKRLTVELCLIKLCQLMGENPVVQNVQPVQPVTASKQVQEPHEPMQRHTAPKEASHYSAPPKLPSLNLHPENTAAPSVQPSETKNAPRSNPFTSDQLNDAWVGLKKHFPGEERLMDLLETCRPVAVSPQLLQLTVASPLQKTEFAKYGSRIMQYVRETLQNDEVKLQVMVAAFDKSKQAYTAAEKYKVLAKQNAVLADLKTSLNLQLE